jgi:hypothetical protein
MERKFNCNFSFGNKKANPVMTEGEIATTFGLPIEFLEGLDLIKEIKADPAPSYKHVLVSYNGEVSYIVSVDKLKNNPHKEGSENWHRFNNDLPLVEKKVKRTDETRFSVNDIKRMIRECPHFNNSPFALILEKELVDNALCELI